MGDAPAPDVVDITRHELEPLAPTSPRVPADRPLEFFVATQIGGHEPNLVQAARTVAVEAWAQSPYAARTLAERGLSRMKALAGRVVDGVGIYRVDVFTAPVDLPDDRTGTPRFRFVVQLFARPQGGDP